VEQALLMTPTGPAGGAPSWRYLASISPANAFTKPCDNFYHVAPDLGLREVPLMNRFVGDTDRLANVEPDPFF
jgi:hypothetical protein